mmetsp:Transcript_8548/g.24531  ORF Transcript_8548/g.24531 Transcript_8548/m.24531 type:complete len:621 (-) Transcript_8548:429-2291(-)|eukprot:CAMPEP_0117671732 /NCGR_PEP_ID=MMETSP0804-20121206/13507_1 /TAXON_ID=1074897 /ORGANISM="Tetraselmis astigmatica, Strain CCMP880" /LENGTH=620 /DNA_ID=CAMNT_0005480245 /DNA_START=105 /DNA_END=1967 /DNA_ORIENTATION=+
MKPSSSPVFALLAICLVAAASARSLRSDLPRDCKPYKATAKCDYGDLVLLNGTSQGPLTISQGPDADAPWRCVMEVASPLAVVCEEQGHGFTLLEGQDGRVACVRPKYDNLTEPWCENEEAGWKVAEYTMTAPDGGGGGRDVLACVLTEFVDAFLKCELPYSPVTTTVDTNGTKEFVNCVHAVQESPVVECVSPLATAVDGKCVVRKRDDTQPVLYSCADPDFDLEDGECVKESSAMAVPGCRDGLTIQPDGTTCASDVVTDLAPIQYCEEPLVFLDGECVEEKPAERICPAGYALQTGGFCAFWDKQEPMLSCTHGALSDDGKTCLSKFGKAVGVQELVCGPGYRQQPGAPKPHGQKSFMCVKHDYTLAETRCSTGWEVAAGRRNACVRRNAAHPSPEYRCETGYTLQQLPSGPNPGTGEFVCRMTSSKLQTSTPVDFYCPPRYVIRRGSGPGTEFQCARTELRNAEPSCGDDYSLQEKNGRLLCARSEPIDDSQDAAAVVYKCREGLDLDETTSTCVSTSTVPGKPYCPAGYLQSAADPARCEILRTEPVKRCRMPGFVPGQDSKCVMLEERQPVIGCHPPFRRVQEQCTYRQETEPKYTCQGGDQLVDGFQCTCGAP